MLNFYPNHARTKRAVGRLFPRVVSGAMADYEATAPGKATGGDEESRAERINREVIELINELRVALVGVQVLFAFLLAVPFAQGFATVTSFQKTLFFGVLCATAIASALLVAPSAYHRINFRAKDKEQMLRTSNTLMIGGLSFLMLSITGSVALIADYIYSPAATVVSAVIGLTLFATLWFVLPFLRRDPDVRAGND